MKIAFIGDAHIDDRKPLSRIDDYTVSVARKVDWALTWCRDNNVDKIVFLGDIFSRKDPGGRSRNMLIKIFKKHYAAENPIEVWTTIGNHDTSNDTANIKTSTLWTLIEVGYLKYGEYDPESKIK